MYDVVFDAWIYCCSHSLCSDGNCAALVDDVVAAMGGVVITSEELLEDGWERGEGRVTHIITDFKIKPTWQLFVGLNLGAYCAVNKQWLRDSLSKKQFISTPLPEHAPHGLRDMDKNHKICKTMRNQHNNTGMGVFTRLCFIVANEFTDTGLDSSLELKAIVKSGGGVFLVGVAWHLYMNV